MLSVWNLELIVACSRREEELSAYRNMLPEKTVPDWSKCIRFQIGVRSRFQIRVHQVFIKVLATQPSDQVENLVFIKVLATPPSSDRGEKSVPDRGEKDVDGTNTAFIR
ncbi:hypothetical protein L2E82_23113 [Cichorium intybus]|uniref:Uncharacterized protein n=1 Tax=Cichorium intybus TaxID=13427 RepID=A0ACB9DZE5_CICIN|nr:hypothetical protein L2E82_23113 [Cichorium intybus]